MKRSKELNGEKRVAQSFLMCQAGERPGRPALAAERVRRELGYIVEREGDELDVAHDRDRLPNGLERPHERVSGTEVVVPKLPTRRR